MVTHQDLTDRARQKTPSAVHVSVDNFMNSPRYDEIVETPGSRPTAAPGSAGAAATPAGTGGRVPAGLRRRARRDECDRARRARPPTRDDAITEAGQLLVAAGAVDPSYVDAMHEREKSVSTYMGNGLAIPHGTNEAKDVDPARPASRSCATPSRSTGRASRPSSCVGIAGAGNDHLALLSKIAQVFLDADEVAALEAATSPADVAAVLDGVTV